MNSIKENIQFKKVSEFLPGTLYQLLKDAYSFDNRYKKRDEYDWKEFDDFFFQNLKIADTYGFITTLNGEAIGFISWDPRHLPDYIEIGYNCICTKYKGNGYGKAQLTEAMRRILKEKPLQVIVTTDEILLPAQRMYESVGFVVKQKRKSKDFSLQQCGNIDYIYPCSSNSSGI